jgi:hypothetical protein
MDSMDANLRQGTANVLVSLPGCMNQDMHYDRLPTDELAPLCYSVLVAIQDNSFLNYREGNQDVKRFILNAGEMIIFRSDFCHGGCSYEGLNIRVHYHFDHKDARPTLSTFLERRYRESLLTTFAFRKAVQFKNNKAVHKAAKAKKALVIINNTRNRKTNC